MQLLAEAAGYRGLLRCVSQRSKPLWFLWNLYSPQMV